jgi:hypothetical protein
LQVGDAGMQNTCPFSIRILSKVFSPSAHRSWPEHFETVNGENDVPKNLAGSEEKISEKNGNFF